MAADWRDNVTETLADGEAAALERAAIVEAERDAYRLLSRSALHQLHDITIDNTRLRGRLGAALDENRRLRRGALTEAA
jgi:hypothetical protein